MSTGKTSGKKLSPRELLRRARQFSSAHKGAAAGIAAGAAILAGVVTYAGVELTSTPAFCTQCHEIEPAHKTYLASSHYLVPEGEPRATCRDCHVPPWSRPVDVLWVKAYHGVKDVALHLLDGDETVKPGYQAMMAASAPHGIRNSSCLSCHDDVFGKQYKGRANIHDLLRKHPDFHCADCHRNLVH